MKKIVVFTDLDGTLLDSQTYSFEPATPALQLLKEKDIPLVLCSSKTRKEIEYYRRKLHNHHPFISENGGGIFIPKGYFSFSLRSLSFNYTEENSYEVIKLGPSYSDLRRAIGELRSDGFCIKGFGDMTAQDLMRLAGMTVEEAMMARERDFDEPFIFEGDASDIGGLYAAIESKGFNYTQGRFLHIIGNSDKGKAVSILCDLYRRGLGELTTVAIGDSPNDIPMLERVDCPVVVRNKDGKYDQRITLPNLIRADGKGPEGWNRVVLELTKDR